MVVLSGNISFGGPFFGAGFRDGGLALVEFLSICCIDTTDLELDCHAQMYSCQSTSTQKTTTLFCQHRRPLRQYVMRLCQPLTSFLDKFRLTIGSVSTYSLGCTMVLSQLCCFLAEVLVVVMGLSSVNRIFVT